MGCFRTGTGTPCPEKLSGVDRGSASKWIRANQFFYGRIQRLLKFIVEPKKRVLELSCDMGDYLACTEPEDRVDVEISDTIVTCA